MKIVKMSLVAAMLCGASAFAIDNVKVDGDGKLYYTTADKSTDDLTNEPEIFDKDASHTDFALRLGATADLTEGVSAGATLSSVFTLGVENNLVSGTWSNAHGAETGNGASFLSGLGGAQVETATWFSEAWIAGTAGKTTAKLGRMQLDTPLVFSETWGMTANTFESVVLLNTDIPDTTLVGAWVGKSNGSGDDQNGILNSNSLTVAGYVAEDGKFSTFGKNGAYVAGAITTAIPMTTAQLWYWELPSLATAYWLQADVNAEGILAGAQYTSIDADTKDDDAAYAVMLGYEMKDVATIKAAYSAVDDKGALGNVGNVATRGGAAQSKLYTEMWWSYGHVSLTGATAYKIGVDTHALGVEWLLDYSFADIDVDGTADDYDIAEAALVASKSYGPLDTAVAVLYETVDYDPTSSHSDHDATMLQVYLTYNF